MRTMLTMVNVVQIIISDIAKLCISDLQCFQTFRNSSLFAHFGFYQISTPVIRTMLTMVNVVQIIISDIAQSVYIKFTMF